MCGTPFTPRHRSCSRDTGRAALSEQSATHRERQQPHQSGQAEATKHGRRTEIFDAPDVLVLLARDVVGEFFDGGVEEFYREHGQQSAYHAGIPGAAWCDEEAERQTYYDEKGFVAQRRLGSKAVGESTQRMLGGAVKTFQD